MQIHLVVPSLTSEGVRQAAVLLNAADRAGWSSTLICNGAAATRAASESGVPHVTYGRNLGYGAAINAAAARTSWDWLVFANDDVIADEAALPELTRLLAGEERGGPRLVFPAAAGRARPVPRATDVLLNVSLLGEAVRRAAHRAPSAPPPVGPLARGRYLPFSFVAADRTAFDALGGFDERFTLYFEDADLMRRFWRLPGATARVVHLPLRHEHSVTAGTFFREVFPVSVQSALRYLGGDRPAAGHRLALLLALLVRSLLCPTVRRVPVAVHLRAIVAAAGVVVADRAAPLPPYGS